MIDLNNKYFNFIVLNGEENWIINKEIERLWISRFLEYTTEETRQLFQSDYNKIMNLPCICTYEGTDSNIYLAKIDTFDIRGRHIHLSVKEFEKQDIDSSEFFIYNEDIIQEFELYRNHWAIKKGNIYEILEKLSKEKSSIKEPATQTISTKSFDNSSIATPKITENSNTKKELYIKDIQDFINNLSKNNKEKITFYRGHSKKSYKLEPSLFRKNEKTGSYNYKEQEGIIYRELLTLNFAEFSNDNSTFDKLVHMQHFSLPTRLLDITSNPLIALYFACKSKDDKNTEDGDLISITLDSGKIKYFDSDTVACIANLCKLNFSEKEHLDLNEENAGLSNKYLHYIRDDKPYFEDRIIDKDIRKVICVKGKSNNPRIYAQSGAFLLFGLEATLEDDNDFGFEIIHHIIKHDDKAKILEQLDLLNINESTVFPYLENSAKYISEKYKKRD